jgi:hypothetical protein
MDRRFVAAGQRFATPGGAAAHLVNEGWHPDGYAYDTAADMVKRGAVLWATTQWYPMSGTAKPVRIECAS